MKQLLPVLMLLAWPGASALPAAEPAKPNVLFIFADDQRADTIAALGNSVIHTPNLDRIVQRGMAFNRAYMQGGLNAATCIPSRAMLLSGKSLFRVDEHLTRQDTWPAAFGRAGYRTFIAGKWHNGTPSLLKSFQDGRAIFIGGMGNPMEVPLWDITGGKLVPSAASSPPKHACERMADAVVQFLKEGAGKPFFCYLPFDAPHDPHIVPENYPVHYDPAKIPLPPNYPPRHPFDNGEMTIRDEQLLPWPRPPDAVRSMIADYYRYISYLDSQIGRVLDALEASPYAKNTIVVFAADSGVARGSHGLIGKQNLYELDSVRVPLIIAGPGIAANQRNEAMCYLFDVLPTLGKICGVAAPPESEGIDLGAALRDPAAPGRTQLLFAYKNVQRAILQGNSKLIRYPYANQTQLFDLQLDPFEENNLADQPEQAGQVAAMTALLRQEMERFGDRAPLQIGPGEAGGSPLPSASLLPPGGEPKTAPIPVVVR
jgi:arylsulfatase A-like enzyme